MASGSTQGQVLPALDRGLLMQESIAGKSSLARIQEPA